MTHQFELGQVVTTAEIYEAMQEHRGFKLDVIEALLKYRNRDWGDTSDGDKEANDWALDNGDRLLAAYETGQGRIWIITEWDRSVTTILFPHEY